MTQTPHQPFDLTHVTGLHPNAKPVAPKPQPAPQVLIQKKDRSSADFLEQLIRQNQANMTTYRQLAQDQRRKFLAGNLLDKISPLFHVQ